MMTGFEIFALPKSLQKAIDELGLLHPTPIQLKSFPVIMSGRDVMAIAQTGTGKTFAYLLPILKLYRFSNSNNPKILILVPTRELVVQVVNDIEKLTPYMSVTTLGIYGGVNINTQKNSVYNGADIVVGTPGRVMDLALDNVLRFDEVQKLVVDEFDEMLNLGFQPQITAILAMMKPKRQNILFSATMTEAVDALLDDYFNNPEEISLVPLGTPLEKITQWAYHVPNFTTKINLLQHLLKENNSLSRVLIFVNNKRIADLLYESLDGNFEGKLGLIHSNKTQNYRLQTIEDFKQGLFRGIITTDVMARGLDISNITHVINFDMPLQPEQYLHRIGRTGRADTTGCAFSLITPKEEEQLIEIEILMNKEIEFKILPASVEVSKVLLGFEKDRDKIKQALKKTKLAGGGAFHEKKNKNKKVNLGGPSKTKKKTSGSVNRNLQRERAKKKNN